MSFDDGTTGDDLVDLLLQEIVESPFDKKEFCPNGCIDTIITAKKISDKLKVLRRPASVEAQEADQRELVRLVDFVSQRSKKIFAIVLCCDLNSEELRQVLTQYEILGLDDSKLPIDGHDNEKILFPSTGKTYERPWTKLRVRNFYSYHWKCLAPVFSNGQGELELHEKQVLPFLSVSLRGQSGTFGEVYQVTIHPDHLRNAVHVSLVHLFP